MNKRLAIALNFAYLRFGHDIVIARTRNTGRRTLRSAAESTDSTTCHKHDIIVNVTMHVLVCYFDFNLKSTCACTLSVCVLVLGPRSELRCRKVSGQGAIHAYDME